MVRDLIERAIGARHYRHAEFAKRWPKLALAITVDGLPWASPRTAQLFSAWSHSFQTSLPGGLGLAQTGERLCRRDASDLHWPMIPRRPTGRGSTDRPSSSTARPERAKLDILT